MEHFPPKLIPILDVVDTESAGMVIVNSLCGFPEWQKQIVKTLLLDSNPQLLEILKQFQTAKNDRQLFQELQALIFAYMRGSIQSVHTSSSWSVSVPKAACADTMQPMTCRMLVPQNVSRLHDPDRGANVSFASCKDESAEPISIPEQCADTRQVDPGLRARKDSQSSNCVGGPSIQESFKILEYKPYLWPQEESFCEYSGFLSAADYIRLLRRVNQQHDYAYSHYKAAVQNAMDALQQHLEMIHTQKPQVAAHCCLMTGERYKTRCSDLVCKGSKSGQSSLLTSQSRLLRLYETQQHLPYSKVNVETEVATSLEPGHDCTNDDFSHSTTAPWSELLNPSQHRGTSSSTQITPAEQETKTMAEAVTKHELTAFNLFVTRTQYSALSLLKDQDIPINVTQSCTVSWSQRNTIRTQSQPSGLLSLSLSCSTLLRYISMKDIIAMRAAKNPEGILTSAFLASSCDALLKSVFRTQCDFTNPMPEIEAAIGQSSTETADVSFATLAFVGSFCFLTKGTAWEKIQTAFGCFQAIGAQRTGLKLRELQTLMRVWFSLLLQSRSRSARGLNPTIEELSAATAMQCFDECRVLPEDQLAAEHFARWLNSQALGLAPTQVSAGAEIANSSFDRSYELIQDASQHDPYATYIDLSFSTISQSDSILPPILLSSPNRNPNVNIPDLRTETQTQTALSTPPPALLRDLVLNMDVGATSNTKLGVSKDRKGEGDTKLPREKTISMSDKENSPTRSANRKRGVNQC